MTRLSIALSTYNGEAFLWDQLRSYVAQTRRPDELVVRDDGSTDGTVDVLRAFAAVAPFPVRVVTGGENVGYVRSFEAAIRACTGDLVALSDQDDVWLPHKLSHLVAALEDDAGALLAFSDAVLVDADLRPLGATMWEAIQFTPALQRDVRAGGARTPFLRRTYVTGATVLFRSALIPLALPVDLVHWHDAWLALVASLYGRVALVGEPLVLYRQHGRNVLGAPARVGALRQAARLIWPDPAVEARTVEVAGRLSEMARQLHNRLAGSGAFESGASMPGASQALAEMQAFHAFRAGLPPYPRRAGAVARRVAGRWYHIYGSGVRTAVRDLFRP